MDLSEYEEREGGVSRNRKPDPAEDSDGLWGDDEDEDFKH
jgi:hypothetical protein